MSKFVALDVETANPDMSSICQIGVVHFDGGVETESWSTLVNPNDYFDGMNMAIHGIGPDDVHSAPTFAQVSDSLNQRLAGEVVAIHTAFDRTAVFRAAQRAQVPAPNCNWLNTASVARRTWPDVAYKGYGLKKLAKKFAIHFEHHDALHDARTAGLVLLQALNTVPLSLADWQLRVTRPIDINTTDGKLARTGNHDGPLFGEVVVFTGALTMSRREAAAAAAQAGCDVGESVTKRTTLLVVGDQDIRALAGYEKSSKHRKAEELSAAGQDLRIVTESDFYALLSSH